VAYITQGDPDAIVLLKHKLDRESARHKLMLRANKDWRASGKPGRTPPHPYSALQKAAMRISYTHQRIARLQITLDAAPRTDFVCGAVILENPLAGRIQIKFPAKPTQNVHDALRANGFRWSGLNMAWQRHLNDEGKAAAKRIAALLIANEAFSK